MLLCHACFTLRKLGASLSTSLQYVWVCARTRVGSMRHKYNWLGWYEYIVKSRYMDHTQLKQECKSNRKWKHERNSSTTSIHEIISRPEMTSQIISVFLYHALYCTPTCNALIFLRVAIQGIHIMLKTYFSYNSYMFLVSVILSFGKLFRNLLVYANFFTWRGGSWKQTSTPLP